MQIPKRLEPPQGASPELDKAYKQVLLDKVSVNERVKQSRKLLDTPEMREKQNEDAIFAWRVNSLLPYAVLCLQEGKREQAKAEAKLAAYEETIKARREWLGAAIGKLLGNMEAGRDLCSLLMRQGGGYFDQDEPGKRHTYQVDVNRWNYMVDVAQRTIGEIEQLKSKPLDSKQAARKNKQNLLANLENQNTEIDNQKGE